MKNANRLVLLSFLAMGFILACGPKTTKEVQKKTTTPAKTTEAVKKAIPTEEVTLSEDAIIDDESDKWGKDSLETRKNISLYREYYKQKLYTDALPYWRYVYQEAPALRKTTYLNGVKIYENLAKETTDKATKKAYLDTMFTIFDDRVKYFGEEGTVSAWKAYKLKKYRPEEKELYKTLITKAVDIQQEDAEYFVLYPYFKQNVLEFNAKTKTAEQVLATYDMLSDIVDYNVTNNEKKAEKYLSTQEKMEKLAQKVMDIVARKEAAIAKAKEAKAIKANTPKTCPEIKQAYESEYRANPNDLGKVKSLLSKLGRAKCKNDPLYFELLKKLFDLEPNARRAKIIAQRLYNSGDYMAAQKYLLEAVKYETDNTKKGTIYMLLASGERRKVDNLTTSVAIQARKYAKKAAELRPGWGKPYMFIGSLYASSGKLCGPGTGWKSQIVTWAAIDMWSKAKDIDPSVASEANKSINQYKKYYPTVADGHMRNVSNGQSFKIGCWIGTNTRARLIK